MEFNVDIQKTLRAGRRSFHLDVRLHSNSQRMVIFGPSGAGKSQTLRAIAGLMTPDTGNIRLGDTTLFDSHAGIDIPPQERKVAYMFQDYALFPHLNVRQNIAFGLVSGWLNPRSGYRHADVDYWLEAFQLGHLALQFPHDLSGGQRQRTALARALVSEPRALLLDEPFAALDPGLRTQMRKELDELQHRLKIPMILITHDPEDTKIFGDSVLCLREGKIDENGDQRHSATLAGGWNGTNTGNVGDNG